jgi:hypothetical protein
MYYSRNKRLFDLVLDKLNDNTQDVTFDGNFMFKFEQSMGGINFSIATLDGLAYQYSKAVPMSMMQSIEIPFVEKNERSDHEVEFYVAIEIPKGTDSVTSQMTLEFQESNPQFQAILETLDTMRDQLTFTEGDWKYSFKVKEPTKVDVFTFNRIKYQILSLQFNLTYMKKGFFGNETKIYMGLSDDSSFGETSDYLLDVVEFQEVMAKTMTSNSLIGEEEETKKADKRTWEATLLVNFNGSLIDLLLYQEKSAQADLDTSYRFKVTNSSLNVYASDNLDYTYTVKVSTCNAVYKNNEVDRLSFKIERA